MVVELTDSTRRQVASSPVGPNGDINFYGVRDGLYGVTVRTVDGTVIYQDMVQTSGNSSPFMINIPDQQRRERPVSGTISVARLKHKVPKQARKEYVKADDKLREGDIQASLEHLKKAVEIDPEFMEALNNIGARYLMLGDMQNAFVSFKRALELDPHSALVQQNMAIVLLSTGDPKGAERAARRSMELDPTDLKAKYIVGLALYNQHIFTEETIAMLSKAQERFPGATMALAYVHEQTGHNDLARKSVKEYLRSGNKEHKQKAEALLANLQ